MLKISKGQKYQILGRKSVKNQRIRCQNFQKSKKIIKNQMTQSQELIETKQKIYMTAQQRKYTR